MKFHRKDKQPHGIRKVKVTLFQQVSFLSNDLHIRSEFQKNSVNVCLCPKTNFLFLFLIRQDVIGILKNTCQKKQMTTEFFWSSWRALIRIIFYPTNFWLPSNCIRRENTADLKLPHGIRKVSHSLSTGKQEVSYLFSQIMHICCFFDQNSDQNSRKILWTSALADRRVDEISSEFFKISWQKKSRWSQLSGFLETKRPHMYLFDKMGNLGHGK